MMVFYFLPPYMRKDMKIDAGILMHQIEGKRVKFSSLRKRKKVNCKFTQKCRRCKKEENVRKIKIVFSKKVRNNYSRFLKQ